MTTLIACLSVGKGTWGPVIKLTGQFDKVFLITNSFGQEKFDAPDNTEMIVLDRNNTEEEMREAIMQGLEGKIDDTEVALNMTSGSGAEHMALLSALLKMGLGIRLVIMGEEEFQEL